MTQLNARTTSSIGTVFKPSLGFVYSWEDMRTSWIRTVCKNHVHIVKPETLEGSLRTLDDAERFMIEP